VRLKTKLSPLCPIAIVDKVQIQQVLINLIRNAVEATGERQTPRILIETAPTQSGMILCSVKDNGTGLTAEVASQLFQPFVTSKKTGMGVGLSITRSIVEAHGGHIWTEPNPEGGAVFRFTVRGPNPVTS
jgi:two-component system sensor kinase FixL